jgi:hypothetical protein
MQDLLSWLPVIGVVGQGLLLWIGWSVRKRFASQEELGTERDARKQLEAKVTLLEGQVQSLPTSAGMHDLAMSIERLRGDMKAITTQLMATGKTIDRVETTIARHEQIFTQAATGRG